MGMSSEGQDRGVREEVLTGLRLALVLYEDALGVVAGAVLELVALFVGGAPVAALVVVQLALDQGAAARLGRDVNVRAGVGHDVC